MDIWGILGIEKTTNETEIKNAYAEKLKIFHPEEDTDGFINLREAYELALKGEEEKLVTEFTMFIDEVKSVYEDFGKRINIENWKEVLRNDLVNRIDTEEEALIALLRYLSENYNLSKNIWVLILDHFSIDERKEELARLIPENFLDYMLSWRKYDDIVRYDKFEIDPNKTTEEYETLISISQDVNHLMLNHNEEESIDKIKPLMKRIDDLGIYNVDIEIFKSRYEYIQENYKKALEISNALNEKHPNDYKVLNSISQVYIALEEYENAINTFEKILELNPEYKSAEVGIAYSNLQLGNYVEAKTQYYDIIKKSTFDAYIGEKYYEVNKILVPHYEKVLENDEPYSENNIELSKDEISLKLASCYFNTLEYEKCRDLLELFKPVKGKESTYASMLIDVYIMLDDSEKVLEVFDEWAHKESIIDERSLFYGRKIEALKKLNRYDEALELAINETDNYPKESLIYLIPAKIHEERKEYDEAIKILRKGIANVTDKLSLLINLSELEYEANNFGAALDAADQVIEIYPYVPNVFITKIKIFYYVGHYEEVFKIAKNFEVFDKKNVDIEYYKGAALRLTYKYKEAIEVLTEAIREFPDDSRAYYDIAICYDNLHEYDNGIKYIELYIEENTEHIGAKMILARFYRKKEEFDEAKRRFNIIIEENPENPIAFMEMGLVFRYSGDIEKAYEYLKKSIDLEPTTSYAYRELGELYNEEKQYNEAVDLYTSFIENVGEDADIFVLRGIAYSRLKEFDKQIADYEKAVELDSEFAWPYNNLGYSYYLKHDYEKAKYYYKISIEKDSAFLNPRRYLAESYFESHEFDEGLDILEEGINLDSFDDNEIITMMLRKQEVLLDINRLEEALLYIKKSIDRYDNVKGFYSNHMLVLLYQGNIDEAIKIGHNASLKYPISPSILANLGDVYRSGRKSYKLAIEYYTKALKISDVEYSDAKFFRGVSYLKVGEFKKAREDFLNAKKTYESYLKTNLADDVLENVNLYVKLGRIEIYLGNIKKAKENLKEARAAALFSNEFYFMISYDIFFLEYLIYSKEKNKDAAIESLDKAIKLLTHYNYKTERELYLSGKDDSQLGFAAKMKNLFKRK